MSSFTKISFTILAIGLVTLVSNAVGQQPAHYLSDIQRLQPIYSDRELDLLPNGKSTILLIFKSCCSTNAVAIHWAVGIHEQYGDSLNIVGIAIDNSRTSNRSKPWLDSRNVKFPCYRDPDREIVKLLGIKTTPSLFVLDQAGHEVNSSRFFSQYDVEKMKTILCDLVKPTS